MALLDNIKEAVTIAYDESVSKAIAKLEETGFSLIVTKEGKYYGVLDDRELKERSMPTDMKVSTVSVKAPALSPFSTVLDAAREFMTGKFKALPVLDREMRILGMLTRADLLKDLADEDLLERGKVKDIMSSPVSTIDVAESVAHARSKMRKEKITHLVVTEKGRAVGIFTTYDLAMEVTKPAERLPFAKQKLSIDSQPIRSFFRKLAGISKDATLKQCAIAMAGQDISELAVVDDGEPVGIVVANDIFKLLTKPLHANIVVSGLEAEDREYMQELMELASHELKKIGIESAVDYVELHVRKKGRQYAVKLHMKGKQIVSVSSDAWDLHGAVKAALLELRKVVLKRKPDRDALAHNAREERRIAHYTKAIAEYATTEP